MERTISFLGKASARILKAAVERMFLKLVAPFNAKHLKVMVDNDWYIIETIRYNASVPQGDYSGAEGKLTPQEIEAIRMRERILLRMALSAMGMAKKTARQFPREVVEQYLTPEYAFKYFREKRPDLIPILETPEGYKWLINQIEEVKEWLWQ